MRIGIDARFFGGEQSKGLGRYTQMLLRYVFELDQRNDYVVFVPEELIKRWPYRHAHVKLVAAPYSWYSLAEQIFMPLLIKRQKVDLMHFPHFNVPIFYRGPFIVTIHDLIISRFPTERATTLGPIMYQFKQFAYNRVISHAALAARHVITVSQYSKADLMDFFHLPGERVSVTYEAVDAFTAAKQDVLQRYGIRQPYLLYVGNAYPHKNLEHIILAMQHLKKQGNPLQCVLVGKPDYFYRRLHQYAWAKNVDDRVKFIGFVPDQDLPNLYQQAFAYVFASRYEGFGLPPLEAMLYGTPVISARTSCLPEVLGDAALYFEQDDISGILKHIQHLQTDPDERARLIQLGRAQVQRYSWQRMAKQTLAIYEKILTQSQTHPAA
ncbi:MAG: glycosyl transferase, group 1 [uncultured bacterium]|nr:MAG: glycosyl transferase, group 1 [uncultured bacterium]HBY73720.1 hypothetical protein [Candidatus Kerfeldbacteria bacterium]